MPDAAFWGLTLRLFCLLLEQHAEAERAQDHRVGTLAATVANIHRDHKRRPQPYTWKDFFGQAEERKPQTEEEMREELFALAERFKGR